MRNNITNSIFIEMIQIISNKFNKYNYKFINKSSELFHKKYIENQDDVTS